MKKILLVLVGIVVLIVFAGVAKFDILANMDGFDVDSNPIIQEVRTDSETKTHVPLEGEGITIALPRETPANMQADDAEKDVMQKASKSTQEGSTQKAPTQKAIYRPRPGISWQWQLDSTLNTSYDVALYDVDLFETPTETIAALHRAGRKVICYFNAGAYEDFRPDASAFPAKVRGKKLDGWEGERWLDVRNYVSFANVMRARLDRAKRKGCDGVEPDNIDGYQAKTGFPLTAEDQLRYNRWLAREAHARGLAIALKNDVDQVSQLVDTFDFAINEECFAYGECAKLLPFIRQGKAVLHTEYTSRRKDFCPITTQMGFSSLKMDEALDGGRKGC